MLILGSSQKLEARKLRDKIANDASKPQTKWLKPLGNQRWKTEYETRAFDQQASHLSRAFWEVVRYFDSRHFIELPEKIR
jgi:hypothetical protein